MQRAKIIADSDCFPHENISHANWVTSQTNRDEKYLVTWYRTNFIAFDFPWSICGNICKHAIKVDWLYFPLGVTNPVLDHDATLASFDAPHEIEEPNIGVDRDITFMATDSVDLDVEGLKLARDELFGYLDILKNSPLATLRNIEQLVDLVKKMLNEANNLHIMDYEFTLGFGAFESSLKRKKSFLSPKKKGKRIKQTGGFEIDLNIHTYEYDPFQFQYLNKQGRLCSNNASSRFSGQFHIVRISM